MADTDGTGRKRRKALTPLGYGDGSVYQRSDGRWEAKVTLPDGSRRKVSAASEDAARAALVELRSTVTAAPRHNGQTTVAAWLDYWLATLPGKVATGTVENYRAVVTRYVTPTVGRVRLAALTPEDVERMLSTLERDGRSPNTRRLARAVLRRSLRLAEARGHVPRNVAALTDGPRVAGSAVRRTLTPEQAAALLDASAGHRLAAATLVGLVTGLRPGELLGLRWEDVDFAAGTLTVAGALKRHGGRPVWEATPKTSRSRRRLRVPVAVLDALREHRRGQAAERLALGGEWGRDGWADVGLVFTTVVGTPMDAANFRHHLARLCDRAGIGRWHPHELRHSAASLALAAGIDLKVVSEMLGHSGIRVTADVYGHLLDGATGQATEAVAALVAGASRARTGP